MFTQTNVSSHILYVPFVMSLQGRTCTVGTCWEYAGTIWHGRIQVWADLAHSPPPPLWQLNHANSAYFGAISANFPSISTLGPLFLQFLGLALYEIRLGLVNALVFQTQKVFIWLYTSPFTDVSQTFWAVIGNIQYHLGWEATKYSFHNFTTYMICLVYFHRFHHLS